MFPTYNKNATAEEYGKKQTGSNKIITEGDKSITILTGYILVDPTKEGNENMSYEDTNNPQIDEGIVITDEVDENGKSTGNEFVWVPVDINKWYFVKNIQAVM